MHNYRKENEINSKFLNKFGIKFGAFWGADTGPSDRNKHVFHRIWRNLLNLTSKWCGVSLIRNSEFPEKILFEHKNMPKGQQISIL